MLSCADVGNIANQLEPDQFKIGTMSPILHRNHVFAGRFSQNLGFAMNQNILYTVVDLDNLVCLASN